jgi:tRNA A37 threonylcarbamoyladenosine modification protein TsaB
MYLLFDLSVPDSIHLSLFDATTRQEYQAPGRDREFLQAVYEFLAAKSCPPENIQGIFVVVGAGRFTSTRIATTIANTWGLVRQIPLMAITVDDIPRVQSLLEAIAATPPGTYLTARYSAPPRLGPQPS